MGDAEIHAATAAEDLVANAAFVGIGVIARTRLGEGDADLHRPAGSHRVEHAEQLPAQGHQAEEVVEDLTQLLLGAHPGQPLLVGLAVGRLEAQRGVHQKTRNMQAVRAPLDLLPGDLRQAGHRRRGLEGRFLHRHGQHGTEVFVAGRNRQGAERRLDIRRPAIAIRNVGRHQPGDLRAYFVRVRRRCHGLPGTTGKCQQRDQQNARREAPPACGVVLK